MVTGILPQVNDPECAELLADYLTDYQRIDRRGVCRGRVILRTTTRCHMMVKQPTLARFVQHAQYISKLAVEVGLEIAGTSSRVKETEDDASFSQPDQTIKKPLRYTDIPRTAFLPLHTMDPVVCMSVFVTPGKFYLQLLSQLNSLTRIEQEVASQVKEHQQSGLLLLIVTGQVVLAKVDQESLYLCAEVGHVGDRLVVSMVDTGGMATVHMEHTLRCPESLVYRIPQQAVQCSLTSVVLVAGDLAVEAGDKLFELSRDSLGNTKAAGVYCDSLLSLLLTLLTRLPPLMRKV